ncbi:MAG: class II fructose-bisphosphate aldolase [Brevinema sp.]
MKDLLQDARRRGYALGAFNITSLCYADAIVDAAQEKNSPVIIAVSERHICKNYLSLEATSSYITHLSQKKSIPIVLHLDHGETIEMIRKAVDCGFHSVMIDRSHSSLNDNIADTLATIEICKAKGISVEGELGMIGGKEGEGHINIADRNLFTQPNTALEYVSKTQVDALAVAIGNVHGRYKGTPNLDFDLLQKIKEIVDVPLVLHGGSGISDDDFRKLIYHGIHKINFYSGNAQSTYQACKEFMSKDPLEKGVDVGELFATIHQAVKSTTMHQMDVFGSSGKI